MKQVADRGRLFMSQLVEHLKPGAVGAASTNWGPSPKRNTLASQLQAEPTADHQIHSSTQTPTMVFLGAPGAGTLVSADRALVCKLFDCTICACHVTTFVTTVHALSL